MKGSIYPLATAIAKVMADNRERTPGDVARKVKAAPDEITRTLRAFAKAGALKVQRVDGVEIFRRAQ